MYLENLSLLCTHSYEYYFTHLEINSLRKVTHLFSNIQIWVIIRN